MNCKLSRECMKKVGIMGQGTIYIILYRHAKQMSATMHQYLFCLLECNRKCLSMGLLNTTQ